MLRNPKTINEISGFGMIRAVVGGMLYGLLCFALGASVLRALLWLLTGY